MPVERKDLTFIPVENATPRYLTVAQIADFNRDGYIKPLQVFSGSEADRNRAYFDQLLAQIPQSGAYSINCYQARCEGIWDLCVSPGILDFIEDLIGPNIICWASHFFCKLPHDKKRVPWHQDAAYWHLAPARTVTAWLAIDDADQDNSAMRFIPGSHALGQLKVRPAAADAVLDIEAVGTERLGTPVSDSLKSGQISLHADMLVHGSLPNRSARRRCGLTMRYCPPEVGFTNAQWASRVEPIVCRGRDPHGRWHHHDRPTGNDVSLENGPLSVGGN